MIVDHIKNLSKYKTLNPHIETIISFMEKKDLHDLPQGKTIINEDVYVIRESYEPREEKDCYFEGHKNYLDIQYVLKGKEAIGYKHINDKEILITDPYNPDKDVTKYNIKEYTKVILTDGLFALVNPEDLHMPKLSIENSKFVEKIVFKLKVKGE